MFSYARKLGNIALFISLLMPLGAHALEDPTRPPGYGAKQGARQVPARPRWQLYSTLIAPARRVANINGELVHQGEIIDGARLVEVQAAKVVLQHDGRQITLSLLPQDFKYTRGAR